MKRFIFGFLAVLFLILNTIPYLHIMADQSLTNSQLKQIGAFALSSLITSGEATELDFSDYTDSDTDFLLGLGELVMTGDPSGLIDAGLDWLGGEIDDAYDSAIQSIREWEYNMSPTLYYWFVDTQPPYELSPTYNNVRDLSQPLRRLLTPPNDDSSDNNIPSDYSFLQNINSLYIKDLDSNNIFSWFSPSNYYYNNSERNIASGTVNSYSYMAYDLTTNHLSTTNNNYINNLNPCTPITITVTGNDNDGYNVTYSNLNFIRCDNWYTPRLGNDGFWSMSLTYKSSIGGYNITGTYQRPDFAGSTYTLISHFDTLTSCLNRLYSQFCNITLIVNGSTWITSFANSPSYPIVIPGQLTIWNDEPLQYEFPSDTYLKLPDLTNIITNAINNSDVVMWSDIADCFVDVNGQAAVAVTKIVRNDYDNLYMEQYPYPAMLVGMTDQTKFNEHLLDSSHAYLSPINTVVQETVGILPSELVGVLTIGAILTIFAVIINRLLE